MLPNKKNKKISLITYLIANGISIPHYCYHNDLPIAGNCRVCLVELKNSMKPIVSCATDLNSIQYNNDIYHDSALIKKARENILEFLLLNHPLDCPICDRVTCFFEKLYLKNKINRILFKKENSQI